MSTFTIYYLLPEIVLAATAVLIYIAGAFLRTDKAWSRLALLGIVVAAVFLSRQQVSAETGVLLGDGFAFYVRWFSLSVGFLFVLFNSRPLAHGGTPEAIGSLLLAIAGGMLVASADNLILLFAALELISIPTYILLYLGPGDAEAQESAAKYFFLSILASALLLYGFSFIYGTTGTMNLGDIRAWLANPYHLPTGFRYLAKLGLLLTLSGLCFRLAAVPFHFYAPDVYQGTSNSNAALLSIIPKVAGLAVLVRLVWETMPGLGYIAWPIAMAVSVLTMTLGNVMALWQNNLRRLMAYSSIAHAGYMLIGLAVALCVGAGAPPAAWDGIAALLFYLCVYAAATLGTFAALEYLGQSSRRIDKIEELAGLCRTRPISAAMIAVFMFSLMGIPPFAIFWGKFQIFGSAMNVYTGLDMHGNVRIWFIALAIIGVLNAAVSAGYYLRIVGVMYFREPAPAPRAEGGAGAWTVAAGCALLSIALFVYPGLLFRASNYARATISQHPKIEKISDLQD